MRSSEPTIDDAIALQIDGLHIGNDLVLIAALGIDAEGHKHPLGLVEGPTENAAVVKALTNDIGQTALTRRRSVSNQKLGPSRDSGCRLVGRRTRR